MSLETYGRYQLLKKLATGGMAQIYLARQVGPEGFEKLLVVKRILPHLAENEEFITMFLDEARIAARLNHPNVVQIFDLGAQDDSYFLAMEYIHGEDARRVWRQAERQGTRVPQPLICRIVIEACAGLDYAHKKTDQAGRPLNIVHRDISPQNILVAFEGGVKIVDFGIAKAADQATVTRSGVLKGKYSYMSPEQAAGSLVDHRTDIFALGVVLYELLTGARLFKRPTDIQTLNAVTECMVPPPSSAMTGIPPDLDAIVMKALAKDRTQRYQEARHLAADLESWLLKNQLPSSTAHLAEFLHTIYADRLAREAEEGRLLVETLDGSRNDEQLIAIATPTSSEPRRTKSIRVPATSGVKPEAKKSAPPPPPPRPTSTKLPPPAEERPPKPNRTPAPSAPRVTSEVSKQGATEASMPTQNDDRGRRGIVIGAVVSGLAAMALFAVLLARGGPDVNLTSTPAGAQVSIGGKPMCRTPCLLPEPKIGVNTLVVTKEGFEPLTTEIEVPSTGTYSPAPFVLEPKGATTPVATPPRPTPRVVVPLPAAVDAGPPTVAPISLEIDSEPTHAKLSINGAAVGTTPFLAKLPPGGSAQVRVELDGYLPLTEVVNTSQSQWRLSLKPVPKKIEPKVVVRKEVPEPKPVGSGVVRFVVKPWATVECGSAYKFGQTPFAEKTMNAGDYTCHFANSELGQAKTVELHVEPGKTQRVFVDFGQTP